MYKHFYRFIDIFSLFWAQQPALLYGLSFLLGSGFALSPHWIYLVPIFVLWVPLISSSTEKTTVLRLLAAFMMLILAFSYVKMTIQFPHLASDKLQLHGTAHLKITSIGISQKHYGANWKYNVKIHSFISDSRLEAKNIPATIQFPSKFSPPSADQNYLVEGTLRQIAPQRYILQPDKDKPWIAIEGTFSLAQMRWNLKQKVSNYIHSHIHNPKSSAFLTAIATGDFQDRLMAYELGRFGLQHIMAISGFHFSIVAAIFNFLFLLAFPRKHATIFILMLLTSYFLFLGCGPSIFRAWIASFLLFAGICLERKSNGLNSLGIALLIVLIYDPLFAQNLGFQFSFAATAAILMLYGPIENALRVLFLKRPLHIALKMGKGTQHGYYFLNACREGIALTLAVHCVALPLTLFYFQKFPALSLLYNLFFPFMVSISITLLILGVLIGTLIAPIGNSFHMLNDRYTHFMLNYTYNVPSSIDVTWRILAPPYEIVLLEITIAFVLGVYALDYLRTKSEEQSDWCFT